MSRWCPREQLMRAYPLPRGNLCVVPDARSVGLTTGLSRDEDALRDEERPGHARALLVELDSELGRDMSVVVAVARHRGENDAVCKCDVADLDGLEKSRSRHLN